jgi:hypothetical protein
MVPFLMIQRLQPTATSWTYDTGSRIRLRMFETFDGNGEDGGWRGVCWIARGTGRTGRTGRSTMAQRRNVHNHTSKGTLRYTTVHYGTQL